LKNTVGDRGDKMINYGEDSGWRRTRVFLGSLPSSVLEPYLVSDGGMGYLISGDGVLDYKWGVEDI
jgi:hypothetical protein